MKTETIWMRLASFIVKLPKYYTMVHIFYESFIKLKFQITNILFNHLIWYDHSSSVESEKLKKSFNAQFFEVVCFIFLFYFVNKVKRGIELKQFNTNSFNR